MSTESLTTKKPSVTTSDAANIDYENVPTYEPPAELLERAEDQTNTAHISGQHLTVPEGNKEVLLTTTTRRQTIKKLNERMAYWAQK